MDIAQLPGSERCFFHKGDYLLHCGEPLTHVYYIVSGRVNRQTQNERGEAVLLQSKNSARMSQSIVGILSLYEMPEDPKVDFDAVAATNCVCYRIPALECKHYYFEHPEFLEELVQAACSISNTIRTMYVARTALPSYVQFARFLQSNAVVTADGRLLPRQYSNLELATTLAVHPVTISRIIGKLEERGAIRKTKSGLLITDENLLNRFAEMKETLNYA